MDIAKLAQEAFFSNVEHSGAGSSILGRLEDYDYAKYGPLLGISDEGSAAGTIAAAGYASAKSIVTGSANAAAVGIIIDGERMTSAGEVPIGADEYAAITKVAFGRTLCSTNVGVRVSARLYQPLPEFQVSDAHKDEEA
jgi:hypothetical protein